MTSEPPEVHLVVPRMLPLISCCNIWEKGAFHVECVEEGNQIKYFLWFKNIDKTINALATIVVKNCTRNDMWKLNFYNDKFFPIDIICLIN